MNEDKEKIIQNVLASMHLDDFDISEEFVDKVRSSICQEKQKTLNSRRK